jgi:mannitol/fructose-specific phosphotransferase system IIA component (Ntr-type)
VASKVLVAVGRSKRGISFKSLDKKRAFLFFLVIAPPVGGAGDYLIALGRIAQAAKMLAKDKRVKKVKDARGFMKLVKELEE